LKKQRYMSESGILTHDPDSPAHSKHHRWRRRVFALCFVSALVFGTIGYRQYDPATPFVDALYYAVQLFAMHAPHLEHTRPLTLQLGRWLAAVTSAFAGLQVAQHMWREEWDALRIRRMKTQQVNVLNVAGPAESTQPGIGQLAEMFLLEVFRNA
jgi:hypothetical protein